MIRRCRPLLGTYVEISANDPLAIERGFAAIAEIHRLMSAHDSASEIGRLNRGGWVALHAWTRDVLQRSLDWSRRSGGAFDIVRSATADWRALAMDGERARLDQRARIDLGGIAKGFAVDRAVEAMIESGAPRGFVNAGGDCRAFGETAVPVIVVEPESRAAFAEISLHDSALATSAAHADGSTDHLSQSPFRSVTVRAENACDADALTKIVWSGSPLAPGLLTECGAQAFTIRADGSVAEAA